MRTFVTEQASAHRLAEAALAPIEAQMGAPASLWVDPGRAFQTMEGFGGAFTEAAAVTWQGLGETQRDPGRLRIAFSRHWSYVMLWHIGSASLSSLSEKACRTLTALAGLNPCSLMSMSSPTGALHQGAHRAGVRSTLDQVTLPVPGQLPVFNLGRTHMDAHHVHLLFRPFEVASRGPTATGKRSTKVQNSWGRSNSI